MREIFQVRLIQRRSGNAKERREERKDTLSSSKRVSACGQSARESGSGVVSLPSSNLGTIKGERKSMSS